MRHLLNSINYSLDTENWYAALMLALCLPDIAARIDGETGKPSEKYKKWAQRWVEPRYTSERSRPRDEEAFEKANAAVRELQIRSAGADFPFEENYKLRAARMKLWADRVTITETRISAADLYALRCAFCHEGVHDLANHYKDRVSKFHITPPKAGCVFHLNSSGTRMQIQVDIFCRDLIFSVEEWLKQAENDTEKAERLAALPLIEPFTELKI